MSWPRKLSVLAWPLAAAAATAGDPVPVAPLPPGGACPPGVAPNYPIVPGAPSLPTYPMPSAPGAAPQPGTTVPSQPGTAAPTQPGTAPGAPGQTPSPSPGPTPDAGAGDLGSSPSTGAFGAAPGAGTGAPGSSTPNLAGNFGGIPYVRRIDTPYPVTAQFAIFNASGQPVRTSNPIPVGAVISTTRQEIDTSRGAFFITENENPRPTSRVYFRYQYFNGVPSGPTGGDSTVLNFNDQQLLAAATAELAHQNAIEAANGNPPLSATPEQVVALLRQDAAAQVAPTQAALVANAGAQARVVNQNVHREVFGFEKAFCSDLFSLGVRVPLVQTDGDSAFALDGLGGISLIFKSLLYNNLETGNLISGGVVLTLPTGPTLPTVAGDVDSTFFQPFLGGIYNCTSRLFFQGFTGAVIPSDDRDVTFCFNDLAVFYTAYRSCGCGAVNYVTPSVEAHIITPLDHRGSKTVPIGLPDIVNMTCALHVGVFDRVNLQAAFVTPVTGPKLFDYEAFFAVNYRF